MSESQTKSKSHRATKRSTVQELRSQIDALDLKIQAAHDQVKQLVWMRVDTYKPLSRSSMEIIQKADNDCEEWFNLKRKLKGTIVKIQAEKEEEQSVLKFTEDDEVDITTLSSLQRKILRTLHDIYPEMIRTTVLAAHVDARISDVKNASQYLVTCKLIDRRHRLNNGNTKGYLMTNFGKTVYERKNKPQPKGD